ncbi:MAG TPA: hypothetical protein VFN10_09155 [Thermoanaerobaculia bacterium]|nr:hypothetical protein [Thermoanaerobaculia bacterium]
MSRRIVSALALVVLAACASSGGDEPQRDTPPPSYRRGAPGSGAGMEMLLPPSRWWHDPQIAEPVNLTNDQIVALDKLGADEDDIEKLERDTMLAVRDFRRTVGESPSADILAAGRRTRELRDTLFDKQVAFLAAQREVLSVEQWKRLQDAIEAQRAPFRRNDGMRGGARGGWGGGRGGRGGGGRRPF